MESLEKEWIQRMKQEIEEQNDIHSLLHLVPSITDTVSSHSQRLSSLPSPSPLQYPPHLRENVLDSKRMGGIEKLRIVVILALTMNDKANNEENEETSDRSSD